MIYVALTLLGGGLIVALAVAVWLVSDPDLWHSTQGGRLLRTGFFAAIVAFFGLALLVIAA